MIARVAQHLITCITKSIRTPTHASVTDTTDILNRDESKIVSDYINSDSTERANRKKEFLESVPTYTRYRRY